MIIRVKAIDLYFYLVMFVYWQSFFVFFLVSTYWTVESFAHFSRAFIPYSDQDRNSSEIPNFVLQNAETTKTQKEKVNKQKIYIY